jgi:hypothetical protein
VWLVADGGYLSGSAGAGIVLVADDGRVIATRAVAFSATSSYEAEARAVWLADRMAADRGLAEVLVYNDNLDAIRWSRAVGIDARDLPFMSGTRRSRGPLHRLAHQLATRARKQPPGWRVEFDGRPPREFHDPAPPAPRLERRQGRRSPGWVGFRGALYDPTSPSFDWWHVWRVVWREVALHHYYAATNGCYALPA